MNSDKKVKYPIQNGQFYEGPTKTGWTKNGQNHK